jgi:type IV pilus assembly protein PilB
MESLGRILVRGKQITQAQLEHALHKQSGCDRMLGDLLIELGYTTPEAVARALSEQQGFPYEELGASFSLSAHEVQLLPESVVRRYGVIARHPDNQPRLTLIMRDPLDLAAVDTVRTLTHMEVHKAISTEARIREVIERYYGASAHIDHELQQMAETTVEPGQEVSGDASENTVDPDQLALQANDAPVVQYVNLLLLEAAQRRASDIHVEPGESDVSVRLRIDGVLRPHAAPPRRLHAAIVTRLKILADMDIAERRLPLDGRFKFRVQGRTIDVRVSSLPEVHGEKMVLRLLDRAALVTDMEQIGFEPSLRHRFQEILSLPHGIVLLTGPTGSGKTTTLYSALSFLRSPGVNIQTVEDPVEYQLPGINQMAARPQIGLGFADALRSILRQDPDIIMVGEIRDRDTADIAMRASLTGHLVLSTLHTNDSASAITRLLDIGIERYLIAATVRLVIAQRLARRVCVACRRPATLTDAEARALAALFPELHDATFFEGCGCAACDQTGFFGRTAILELLELTDPLRTLVSGGCDENTLRQRAFSLGMQSLLQNGVAKAQRGITTVHEILGICVDN